MKLRVTIDTDECDMDRLEPYVLEVDNEGVASMWYGSHSYFVPFKDVEIISCKHDVGTRDVRNDHGDCKSTWETHKECLDCGNAVGSVEYGLLNE
tara:strand:+ start:105 stop:389 length:285 start_codon:yes stop_codon:yes gene_type:complete